MSIIKLSNLINGNNILRMPQGDDAGDSAATFDPAKVAQAKLEDLKLQEKQREIERDIANILGDQLTTAEKQIELERIRVGNAKELIDSLLEESIIRKQVGDTVEESFKFDEKSKNIIENKIKSLQLEAEFTEEIKALKEAQLNDEKAVLQAVTNISNKMESIRATQEISKELQRDITSQSAALSRKMGLNSKFSESFAGNMASIAVNMFKADKSLLFTNIASLGQSFEVFNIAGSIFDKMIDNFKALDKAAVDLKVSTGFVGDFRSEMTSLSQETAKFGLSMEKSNTALKNIKTIITGMNLDTTGLAKNLALSAARMEKFGVSSEQTSKSLNILMKSLNIDGQIAAGMLEEMTAGAEELGLTASELSKEFNATMGYLASFGAEGVKAFKELAAQAGVTGVAINSLLGLTKAFDKFGEGAKKAATLNAVLGTNLSSMALMTMNSADRMKELRKQINMATGGVDNMTQAQKLFTKEAVGYASVEEMMRDLRGDPAEMDRRLANAKAQADIQERLKNALIELLPVAEQLSFVFEKIARDEGFINFISNVAKLISLLADNYVVLGTVITAATAATKLGLHMKMLKKKADLAELTQMHLNQIAEAKGTTQKLAAIQANNAHTAAIARNTAAMRANYIAGGASILMMLAMFYMLHKTGSPMFYMMFDFIALGVTKLNMALNTMTVNGLMGAVALAILAGAVFAIFYGINMLVESIIKLMTVLIDGVDAIPTLTLSLIGLGLGFAFLGNMASVGALGIFAGLGALAAMLLLFKATGTSMSDLFGAGDEILKIGSGIEKFGSGLNNIKSAVGELKNSIGEKGLFAGSLTGDSTSLVMGDGVAIGKLFKNSKIEVDVNMPEVSMPKINVQVFVGGTELEQVIAPIVRSEMNRNR